MESKTQIPYVFLLTNVLSKNVEGTLYTHTYRITPKWKENAAWSYNFVVDLFFFFLLWLLRSLLLFNAFAYLFTISFSPRKFVLSHDTAKFHKCPHLKINRHGCGQNATIMSRYYSYIFRYPIVLVNAYYGKQGGRGPCIHTWEENDT